MNYTVIAGYKDVEGIVHEVTIRLKEDVRKEMKVGDLADLTAAIQTWLGQNSLQVMLQNAIFRRLEDDHKFKASNLEVLVR